MTESERDHFESGIAVLQADNTSEDVPLQEPYQVSGVALPVNTVVEGGQGERHYYPEEVLRDAADMLSGVDIVKNFHELDGQAPADDVIGKVTDAAYRDGVGLVYEGEITDNEIAQKVGHGYLEVSPSLGRALGDYDDGMDARKVEHLAGFRDLAVVANGQPGADIKLGENAAITALGRDALSQVLDGNESAESDVDPDGRGGPSNDDPTGASSSGRDTTNEATTMSDGDTLSDEEKAILAASKGVDNARDVLQSYAAAEEPTITEQDELDALQSEKQALEEDVDELAGVFREVLAEQKDLSEDVVSDLSVDALTSEFRNDDGEIETTTLSQTPETGEPDTLEGGDGVDFDALDGDTQSEIESLAARAETMESVDPDYADELRGQAADLADAESFEDIEEEI